MGPFPPVDELQQLVRARVQLVGGGRQADELRDGGGGGLGEGAVHLPVGRAAEEGLQPCRAAKQLLQPNNSYN